jgi:uncharacterized protein YndB with AHSA1/START domain
MSIAMTEVQKREHLRVEVRRVIRAGRQRIYEALTNPKEIQKWFGPANVSVLHAEADVREGGLYRIETTACQNANGGAETIMRSRVSGEYLNVIPNLLLRFTWRSEWNADEETVVTIQLRDVENGTEVTVKHEGFTSEMSRDRHEQGWTGTMEKLSSYLGQAQGNSPEVADSLRIELRRVIRASRQRVFEAWTRPELICKWFGPGAIRMSQVEMDVRPGGTYRFEMQGTIEGDPQQADRRISVEGEYTQVIPNDMVSFTWRPMWRPGEESQVTVHLRDVEGGTEIELTHERFGDTESRNGHNRGWTDTLGKLAACLQG